MLKNNFKKKTRILLTVVLAVTIIGSLAGCGSSTTVSSNTSSSNKVESLKDIEAAAKKEGKVVSVGMPDDWADWKDTWNGITSKYGISHVDTDMSSAEELSKFEAEKNTPTADIGDVGMMFGPTAAKKDLVQAYKTSYWDKLPSWAKDKDGKWVVEYQGTMAFLTNKKLVKNPPKSWADIEKGNYKVTIDDVTKAAEAQNGVLSAAIAKGGDEKNIQPGLDFFAKLAKAGRLSIVKPNIATLEKGETEVAIVWDFNALGYRDELGKDGYEVTIPSDGTVVSGYASVINKYAPHPNAAKLAREYILSDAGQINLAKGYARPIRSDVKLPADVKAKLLPASEYKNAKAIKDKDAWAETLNDLPENWQSKVLINVK